MCSPQSRPDSLSYPVTGNHVASMNLATGTLASSPASQPWTSAPPPAQQSGHPQFKKERLGPNKSQLIKDNIRIYTQGPPVLGSASIWRGAYDALHVERCYQMNLLQSQALRSTEYMRRLASVQEQLMATDLPAKHRRRLRKRASLLQCRINETSRQEKTILVRLGEIFVEAQNYERWNMVQNERWLLPAYNFVDSPLMSSAATDLTTSDISWDTSASLDASSPVFMPSGFLRTPLSQYALPGFRHEQMYRESSKKAVVVPGMGREAYMDVDGVCIVHEPDALGNHGLSFEYEINDVLELCQAPTKENISTSNELATEQPLRMLERRPSLPGLKCTWPDNEAMMHTCTY